MEQFIKDKLHVQVYGNRKALGIAAAHTIGDRITELMNIKREINIIFASAPSQNEFLDELVTMKIDWSRIRAFHMDEYIGLDPDAPQGFGNYLKRKLFSKVECRRVYYLNGCAADAAEECARYARLLEKHPVDIVCLGIGENTHLAFNDPPVANFKDPQAVKVVELDMACRMQQIHDGCFARIEEVPTHALTITIPALLEATNAYAIVPGERKANAIERTINADIETKYPSTILRKHPHALLFIDLDSASGLIEPPGLS